MDHLDILDDNLDIEGSDPIYPLVSGGRSMVIAIGSLQTSLCEWASFPLIEL